MLALIYIFVTAKPISVRRLCLLYVFVLGSVHLSLGLVRLEGVASIATVVATSTTLLAWIFPLFQIWRDVIRAERLAPEALNHVPGSVRFTYVCVFAALPLIALRSLVSPIHLMRLEDLAHTIAVAAVVGPAFGVAIQIRQEDSSKRRRKLGRVTFSRLCHMHPLRHGPALLGERGGTTSCRDA